MTPLDGIWTTTYPVTHGNCHGVHRPDETILGGSYCRSALEKEKEDIT